MPKYDINVISWNIGKNITISKLHELINGNTTSEILILGFQELSALKIKLLTRYLVEVLEVYGYKLLIQKSTCNVNMFNNFTIFTAIFIKKSSMSSISVVNSDNKCTNLYQTKGFVSLQIKYNKLILDIINVHVPFNNIETSRHFLREMHVNLKKKGFTSPNKILLGDFNSRSLIVDKCYMKDVSNCNANDSVEDYSSSLSKYCKLKSYLEGLSLKNSCRSIGRYHKRLNITESKCKNITKRSICSTRKMKLTKSNVLKTLIQNDLFVKDCFFRNLKYKEGEIKFYPTYKRDPQSGQFRLSKDNNGRLPGYADRIFYTGNVLSVSKYNSLCVKGNDHLPICASFKKK